MFNYTVALGWGCVALFIIGGMIVPPQLSGWGYALDRDVGLLGFHFGGKWKLVRWSWGIGGMELIPLLTQFNRLWSWGGGVNLGGEGTGGKCPRKTNTI